MAIWPRSPVASSHRPAWCAMAVLVSLSSAGLASAASAPAAWREPAVPAASAPAVDAMPWWSGFHDPVLDQLLRRLGDDRTLERSARRELELRTAGLYVQMRSLALRSQLVEEWLDLIGEQATAVRAQGPTRQAAQADTVLAQQVLVLEQRQRLLAERLDAWKAVLARLQGQDIGLPDGLDRQLMQPSPPWFEPLGSAAVLAWRWAPDDTRAALLRLQQGQRAAQDAWQRQQTAVRALQRQRTQGAIGDAEVATGVQQLLLRIDALAEASAELALAWIDVFADAPAGVFEARQGP